MTTIPTAATVTTMTNAAIMEKKPKKLRHEIKYNINHAEAMILSGRLARIMKHDDYADSHGSYRVSSLYFDTPYDKALREKLDGVRDREKFRIRYYNDDTGFIRLEKKYKTRGLCAKRSARLTEDECMRIIHGDIAFLMERGDPLLAEFYSKLRGQLLKPARIVTYNREAFMYTPGNVRVTIDTDLATYTGTDCFFRLHDAKLDMTEGVAVLEVKYDEFLPDVVRLMIGDIGRKSTAYSKYAVARRYQ